MHKNWRKIGKMSTKIETGKRRRFVGKATVKIEKDLLHSPVSTRNVRRMNKK